MFLTEPRRSFHSLGVATWEELSSSVARDLQELYFKVKLLLVRRLYLPVVLLTEIRSLLYDGASPCIALKVINKTLENNSILKVPIKWKIGIKFYVLVLKNFLILKDGV